MEDSHEHDEWEGNYEELDKYEDLTHQQDSIDNYEPLKRNTDAYNIHVSVSFEWLISPYYGDNRTSRRLGLTLDKVQLLPYIRTLYCLIVPQSIQRVSYCMKFCK